MELIDDTPTAPVHPFPRNPPFEFPNSFARKAVPNLIAFEGPDGVGKTTVIAAVVEELLARGERVETRRLRGSDVVQHSYRRAHWVNADPLTMNLIDWTSLFDETSRALSSSPPEPQIIVFDRYWASAYVRGAIDGVPKSVLDALAAVAPRPARTYLLRAPAATCWNRLGAQCHSLESDLGARYFEAGRDRLVPGGRHPNFIEYQRVSMQMLDELRDESWETVDATLPPDEVAKSVIADLGLGAVEEGCVRA